MYRNFLGLLTYAFAHAIDKKIDFLFENSRVDWSYWYHFTSFLIPYRFPTVNQFVQFRKNSRIKPRNRTVSYSICTGIILYRTVQIGPNSRSISKLIHLNENWTRAQLALNGSRLTR